MFNTSVLPQVKLRSALRLIENDADSHNKKQLIFESGRSRHCVEPGASYPSVLGPLTVLRITKAEVCYFQGGLVYFVSKLDFMNLVSNLCIGCQGAANGTSSTRLVSEVEVEFILGIVSAVGPMACWTILGSELVTFIRSKRQKIGKWTAQIASLFLARMILKNYAIGLYQKLSGLHADQAWSNLSEAVSTDDTSIFRFTGRLLGLYGSDELVERAINLRWSVFSCIFKGFEAVLDATPGSEENAAKGQQARVKDLATSLGNLGIRLANSDLQSLLQAIHRHPNEIKMSIVLLRTAFEDEAP
jgi:hypothetical protein